MSDHDDLSTWRDDPLVRALRAPGTEAELAGEKEMVAAYRAAGPRRRLGRVIGRLGVGGTAVVTTVALSSGVAAAAYTQALPEPVQRFAHDVLGPIGVPAAPKAELGPRSRARTVPPPKPVTPAPSPTSQVTRTATPDETPTPTPMARAPQPTRLPSASPTPSQTPQTAAPPPSETPTPTPSTSPAPTSPVTEPPAPLRRAPAGLSISISAARVEVGTSVTVSGDVTAGDGQPLGNREVRLVSRRPGERTWTRVGIGRTGTSGSVQLTTVALEENAVLRLRTRNGVRSEAQRVVVVPEVSATIGDGVVDVATVGGTHGDLVVLLRWRQGTLVQVGSASLDAEGTAQLTVPGKQRAVRYVVRLEATPLHARAQTSVQAPAVG